MIKWFILGGILGLGIKEMIYSTCLINKEIDKIFENSDSSDINKNDI